MSLLTSLPLQVRGASILGADSRPVRLAGVNWGGAQQDEGIAGGLDWLPRGEIIDRIVAWGFNHVRFPYATGAFVRGDGTARTAPAKASRLAANPDLQGLTPWQVYQQLVEDMTAAGLYVIVNQHLHFPGWCCSQADNNGLWYNDNWPSSAFTNCWEMIGQRFAGNHLVGYDLHNEPRPAVIGGRLVTPTWGDGNPATDMRQLYQNTAGRLRAAHPGCLVFCEGLAYASDLRGWKAHPVTGPGIVASVHDYPWFHQGPDGAQQSPDAYAAAMDAKGGYLVQQGLAPLWIGEAGCSTDVSLAAFTSGWLPAFMAWAQARRVHWCWWELAATGVLGTEPATGKVQAEPGRREPFGLMAGHDWGGSQAAALAVLAPLMQ